MNIKKWVGKVEKEINDILKINPKDRLDCTASIAKCNHAMTASVMGLSEWLKNSNIMNEFTEEEMNNMHDEFVEITSKFLTFDIKWTKTLAKKFKITDVDDIGIDKDKPKSKRVEISDDEDDDECEPYVPPERDINERNYIA